MDMFLSRLGTVSVSLDTCLFPSHLIWGGGTSQGVGFLEGWAFRFDMWEISAIEHFCPHRIDPGPRFEVLIAIGATKGTSCVK